MQAVILAAGNSTRMQPFDTRHKSTLQLLGKPIIQRTIESLAQNGVTEAIILVSSTNGVKECLENLSFSIPIKIVVSEGARGMGETILDAKESLKEKFFLTLAHHIDAGEHLQDFSSHMSGKELVTLIKKEENLSPYGAVKVENGYITEIVEKPKNPQDFSFRIVGEYLLNRRFIEVLEKQKKHHYSFEDALLVVGKENRLRAIETKKDVVSLKYAFQLLDMMDYLLKRQKRTIAKEAEVSNSATIEGEVVIESGVKILENAVIKGPAYIGKDTFVGNNVVIRGGVSLERGVVLGTNSEVKHALVGRNSSMHSGYLGDSVLGEGVKIAAVFTTGNVRLDRKNVTTIIKENNIDSGKRNLGVMIGDSVKIGIRSSTMPGITIGRDCVIGPQTVVFKNLLPGSTFYAKFDETVHKGHDHPHPHPHKHDHDVEDQKKEPVLLFDIDYTLFDTHGFKKSNLTEFKLYEETVATLEALGANVTLGIFSEGDLDFQKTKLVETKIEERFDKKHIHIVKSKNDTLSEVLTKYKNRRLILIDDKLEVLEKAESISDNVFTIWIERGPFAMETKSSFMPDKKVRSLSEVIEIVSNL